MKKWIKASEEDVQINSNADVVAFLNSKGIDTTKNQYELTYKFYGRFGEDSNFSVKFTCPGDYLALFSTAFAGLDEKSAIPSYKNILNYFWDDIHEFVDVVDNHLTYNDLYKYGEYKEWFGREEFGHISLKNLTTNTTLVEDHDEDDYDYYEEEWED